MMLSNVCKEGHHNCCHSAHYPWCEIPSSRSVFWATWSSLQTPEKTSSLWILRKMWQTQRVMQKRFCTQASIWPPVTAPDSVCVHSNAQTLHWGYCFHFGLQTIESWSHDSSPIIGLCHKLILKIVSPACSHFKTSKTDWASRPPQKHQKINWSAPEFYLHYPHSEQWRELGTAGYISGFIHLPSKKGSILNFISDLIRNGGCKSRDQVILNSVWHTRKHSWGLELCGQDRVIFS